MELHKDHLLTHLFTLRPTEEHLKSLAVYLKTYENHYKTIIEGIRFVHQRSSIHHRITIYYLINELLNMNITSGLVIELRSFIRIFFIQDITITQNFDFLNKKILDLEKFWRKKGLVDAEEYNLEDLILKIKDSFKDKRKLIELLENALEHYKKN